MLVGIGYDIHRLVKKRKLIIGGVEIPYDKGLTGHSDADVLIHAICDALLGAATCGDIGEHFPDTDERFKDISSIKLLEQTFSMVDEKGYSVNNIDTVIIADRPKLAPYKGKMREIIAKILRIDSDKINIKAATEEGTRKVEAIAAYAIAALKE